MNENRSLLLINSIEKLAHLCVIDIFSSINKPINKPIILNTIQDLSESNQTFESNQASFFRQGE